MNQLDEDPTFEEHLLQGLLEVHAGGPASTASPHWHRAVVPVVVALALGGAAVGVAVAGGPGANGPGPGGSTHAAVAPTGSTVLHAESIAAVTGHVDHALANTSNLVMHLTTTIVPTGVRWEYWSDAATGRYRAESFDASGAPLNEFEGDAAGYRVVDYADRAWWTFGAGATAPRGHLETPAAVKRRLADGELRIVGHETVNGHDTLHLTGSALIGVDPATSPAGFDLWVDATTYLPVRSENTKRTGTGRTATTSVVAQGDYTWTPRRPSALAPLATPVPAGFRHLSGPPARLLAPGGSGNG